MAKNLQRTFGWVQNPGELCKLRTVVASLCSGTNERTALIQTKFPLLKHNGFISDEDYTDFIDELSKDSYSYAKLKGKAGKTRGTALCTGIIQAILDAQKLITIKDLNDNTIITNKPYSDDWTSDGYLRWAVSVGFINYDAKSDQCTVSDAGKALAITKIGSNEEKDLLGNALLTYPPAVRVLQLLSNNTSGVALTKFELGNQLGFKGELGFTSIPQEQFVASVCEAETKEEKKKIVTNVEGDSDKYARMIAGWMSQLGWVNKTPKTVTETFLGNTYSLEINSAYTITIAGLNALKKANGYSKYPRIPRRVLFQMLASKAKGVDYLRKRRACIIEVLVNNGKTLSQIKEYLSKNDIETNEEVIKDDIEGLNNIGLSITLSGDKYLLEDKIEGLVIPKDTIQADDLNKLKDIIAKRLSYIDHRYLILVDLAYSSKTGKDKNADARQFEIETANLFTKELDFVGERLGDSNKPDVIISFNSAGVIIDNKSYQDGFSVDKKCADEMFRYISHNKNRNPKVPANEWWKHFDPSVTQFSFLFITSKLVGDYSNNLHELSANSGINGGAIGVDNLLYLSDKLKNNEISYDSFFDLFQNEEIVVST